MQIDEIEQRKEEEMQKAMKKLEMAQQMQKQVSNIDTGFIKLRCHFCLFLLLQHSVVDSKFLVTVYIKNKEGHAFTSKVCHMYVILITLCDIDYHSV